MTAQKHLLHVFYSFGIGGAEIRTALLLNKLGRQYRHSIVSLSGNFDCMTRLSPDLDVEQVAAPDLSGGLPFRLGAIRGLLKQVKPDLLMTRNWGTIEFALANMFGRLCPQIHHEEGFNADETDGQLARRILTRRLALSGVDGVFVPSRVLEAVARKTWRVRPDKIFYFPNGIDCGAYQQPPVPDAIPGFERQDGDIVIGTVATVRAVKNLSRLVRVFARVASFHPARLVIVGEGDDLQTVRDEANRHGVSDRVHFPGYLSDPAAFIGHFDIFAMSSDSEQMPLGVIEGMAAGLPVVSTDVGDVADMVSAENKSFIVPVEDEDMFVACLSQLATDAPLRQSMGQKNRDKALAEFTLDKMCDANEAMINAVLSKY